MTSPRLRSPRLPRHSLSSRRQLVRDAHSNMPESPTDRGIRPVVHTAAPTSSSPPADAFASAPYPLFATGSYDPGEYDYPPPLLYGPLLRPMRNPLQPLSAASTVRPTSSRPPAAVAKPVRAANGAPTPAAEFPSTSTFLSLPRCSAPPLLANPCAARPGETVAREERSKLLTHLVPARRHPHGPPRQARGASAPAGGRRGRGRRRGGGR